MGELSNSEIAELCKPANAETKVCISNTAMYFLAI